MTISPTKAFRFHLHHIFIKAASEKGLWVPIPEVNILQDWLTKSLLLFEKHFKSKQVELKHLSYLNMSKNNLNQSHGFVLTIFNLSFY